MKKVMLSIALIMIATTLMAAFPAGENVEQQHRKLCVDPATGQNIPCSPMPYPPGGYKIKIPGQGEPTMEKITYFYYLTSSRGLKKWFFWNWYKGSLKTFYVANYGCMVWYWRIHTWKTPVGCQFRYQY